MPRIFSHRELSTFGSGLERGRRGDGHATRVKRFASFHSDWGSWYFEVPVAPHKKAGGWSRPRYKVDAVCVLGVMHQVLPPVKWSESAWTDEMGRRIFENRKVALVEAKTGPLSHTAIGQLLTYQDEFESNWRCDIASRWVVCASAADELIEIYNSNDISVVVMPRGSHDPGQWEFFEA